MAAYDVNYEDERFQEVEADKQAAMGDLEQTYNGIIGNVDQYYNAQIDASKQWAETQSQLQQEQTDFTIEQIEQQKAQAQKDYTKEQSGAYADWKKQSNQYGVAAEQQAAAGLAGSGYSESSQVSMYNTYQNRVSTARESYNQAVLNYNNAIKDARLQNNAALAEIAYQALQQQLELSLEGFQYKNQLILEQANKKVEMDNIYYNRYQDVLNQINTENAMAEEIRQFNKNYELETKRLDESIRQFEMDHEQRIAEYEEGIRQFNEEIDRLKKKDKQEYELEIKQLELQKQAMEEEKRQFEANQQLEYARLAEQKRQYDDSKKAYEGLFLTGDEDDSYEVSTPYYKGALNSDAKVFGTFSNGYQPKGITNHGTLTATGKQVEVHTVTLDGEDELLLQNVWRAADGTTWYWEGRENKYKQISTSTVSGARTTGIGWKAYATN